MTFAQLRVLVALEELGRFTDVAEKLGITQSAVSHSLAGLEEELGTPLVYRDRRGGVPTEAGKRVLAHAREVLARMDRIREDVSALAGLTVGAVRVGSLQSVAARVLPGVVTRFRTKYPGIEVSVFEGTDPEIFEWFGSDTVELGIVTARADRMETRFLMKDRLMAVLPECHPLIARSEITLQELSEWPLIRAFGTCGTLVASGLAGIGIAPGPKMIEARSLETLAAMVRAGAGAGILPELALPSDRSGVKVVPIEPPLVRELVLVAPSFEALSPAAMAFADAVQSYVRDRKNPGKGNWADSSE
jgi:DNA-binding transcriptional LysR family regulator